MGFIFYPVSKVNLTRHRGKEFPIMPSLFWIKKIIPTSKMISLIISTSEVTIFNLTQKEMIKNSYFSQHHDLYHSVLGIFLLFQ